MFWISNNNVIDVTSYFLRLRVFFFFQMACFDILKNFSYLVTTQAMQVKTNMILSVLKIAEVDILLPASNSWSTSVSPNVGMLALTMVTIKVLF